MFFLLCSIGILQQFKKNNNTISHQIKWDNELIWMDLRIGIKKRGQKSWTVFYYLHNFEFSFDFSVQKFRIEGRNKVYYERKKTWTNGNWKRGSGVDIKIKKKLNIRKMNYTFTPPDRQFKRINIYKFKSGEKTPNLFSIRRGKFMVRN